MHKKNILRGLILVVAAVVIYCFYKYDLKSYLSFDSLKAQQDTFYNYYQQNTFSTLALYFLIYVVATALSLPGAAILTLAGGAIFGFWVGLLIVSFASSIGATLSFLSARFILRDWVQEKFGHKLSAINEGFKKDGAFYLFTLRMIPVFPFFMVNLVTGLTPIKTSTYYIISQIGMLAGTAVYVNAGTQLASIESASGILSPKILLSFALLGAFPIIAKKIIGVFKKKQS